MKHEIKETVRGLMANAIPLEEQGLSLNKQEFRTANISPEARLDSKAVGFWSRGVTAFFDVRVTHVNAASNQNKSTSTTFQGQENELEEAVSA
ncbi:Hypothetical predicted protein [Paramuricea clavata]|uniref:Uncharacterized protein n=1 Tax=Paramuricea clavata TaxID=317549 RepID=A0A7D9HIY9_PARCT|nr:Hypothetical predicted protein [Paramuricea clavata]